MKAATFFSAKEIESWMSLQINIRFNCFLLKFCQAYGLNFDEALAKTKQILSEAEIPQNEDNDCENNPHQ